MQKRLWKHKNQSEFAKTHKKHKKKLFAIVLMTSASFCSKVQLLQKIMPLYHCQEILLLLLMLVTK